MNTLATPSNVTPLTDAAKRWAYPRPDGGVSFETWGSDDDAACVTVEHMADVELELADVLRQFAESQAQTKAARDALGLCVVAIRNPAANRQMALSAGEDALHQPAPPVVRLDAILKAFHNNQPCDLISALEGAHEAMEHLFDAHGCDTHGHERWMAIRDLLPVFVQDIKAVIAPAIIAAEEKEEA